MERRAAIRHRGASQRDRSHARGAQRSMATLLWSGTPGDLERPQATVRITLATMIRKTSKCRHPPGESHLQKEERMCKGCLRRFVRNVSASTHLLPRSRGAKDLERVARSDG